MRQRAWIKEIPYYEARLPPRSSEDRSADGRSGRGARHDLAADCARASHRPWLLLLRARTLDDRSYFVGFRLARTLYVRCRKARHTARTGSVLAKPQRPVIPGHTSITGRRPGPTDRWAESLCSTRSPTSETSTADCRLRPLTTGFERSGGTNGSSRTQTMTRCGEPGSVRP